MMYKMFFPFHFDSVHNLRIIRAAKREYRKDVCFSAVKNSGTMDNARNATRLGEERPYLIHFPSIRTNTTLKDSLMEKVVRFFFEIIERKRCSPDASLIVRYVLFLMVI